eukprot:m.319876 g.319876  ORF g.319876 m.319876 type:complete len:90 (+) comp55501_c0_seq3:225-494(+)
MMVDWYQIDSDAVREQWCPDLPLDAAALQQLVSSHFHNIKTRHQELAALFSRLPDPAARELYLGNFVEHLVYRVLGIELTIDFLFVCFS